MAFVRLSEGDTPVCCHCWPVRRACCVSLRCRLRSWPVGGVGADIPGVMVCFRGVQPIDRGNFRRLEQATGLMRHNFPTDRRGLFCQAHSVFSPGEFLSEAGLMHETGLGYPVYFSANITGCTPE